MMLETAIQLAEHEKITTPQIEAVIACLDNSLRVASGHDQPVRLVAYRSKRIFELALALREVA